VAEPSAPLRACVIMPVYNEANTVAEVLASVRRYFPGQLVIVDDGSTDGTSAHLHEVDGVTVVSHGENRGYGASLLDGFAEAGRLGAGVAVTMDVDGQHEPAHIPQFLERLAANGADVVSGSRYLPESVADGEAPPDRAAINRRVTEEIRRVTGWEISDSFCGFKAYRTAALQRLALSEPGYALPLEFWAKAYRAGLHVVEMPVERIYNDHDRSFGEDLDDPAKRYDYYMRVWHRALDEGE
jgi:glycosyltransferase involved in cell wall biosynthesis